MPTTKSPLLPWEIEEQFHKRVIASNNPYAKATYKLNKHCQLAYAESSNLKDVEVTIKKVNVTVEEGEGDGKVLSTKMKSVIKFQPVAPPPPRPTVPSMPYIPQMMGPANYDGAAMDPYCCL